VKADLLALHNQKAYRAVGTLVYVLSTLAVGVVALGALAHEWQGIAFSVEFALLAVILGMVYGANWLEVHKKWIECRFLAERVRSAIFFAICGVEMPPERVPPYMGSAHSPNHWMIKVFAEIARKLPAPGSVTIDPVAVFKPYIRVHWIEDQLRFHAKKEAVSGKTNSRSELVSVVVFGLALVAAGSHLFFQVGTPPRLLETLLTFLAIILPAIGAGLGGLRSHREYSRIEKRSANMQLALDDILDQFDYTESKEDFSRLMIEIGELMLRETQDWLMLMKFAELKPAA
jgi:ABC-type amino acid transport system permease subunit